MAQHDTEPSPRPPDRQQAIHRLLKDRDFRLLWSGQLLSQIGDQCLMVAAMTLILNISDSLYALLIPAVSLALPQLVFGLLGGVMADRSNRKLMMIGSDLLRGIIVLAILLVNDAQDLWILYLAAGALAFAGVFFYPARNAAIPNIVEPELLLAANGLIQGSYIVGLIVGSAIAGVAVELWMPSAIFIESLSFFASAFLISAINIPTSTVKPSSIDEEESMWEDMKGGLQFIFHSRALRQVLSITAIATLGIGAIIILALHHLETRLGAGNPESELGAGGLRYGLAMSILGVGAVLGGVIVNRLSRRLSTNAIVGGMLVCGGAAIIFFAWAPNYWTVLISVALIGLCIVVARGALVAISQALSPDAIQGRVQSAVYLIVAAGTVIGEGLAAFLGSILGVQAVFVATGLMMASAGIAANFALRDAAKAVSRAAIVGKA